MIVGNRYDACGESTCHDKSYYYYPSDPYTDPSKPRDSQYYYPGGGEGGGRGMCLNRTYTNPFCKSIPFNDLALQADVYTMQWRLSTL